MEIKTYGEESEGIIIDLCNKSLMVDFYIYEIRPKEVISYQYRMLKRGSIREVHLLFYDGHYDLVEKNNNLAEEWKDEKKEEEEYYMEVNSNMLKGECIECSK